MKTKEINKKKLFIDLEKQYENDYKLMKVITLTKDMRNSNNPLTERKNHLRYIMTRINDEHDINNEQKEKDLRLSNQNFHNEYNLFNKRKNKKDTKSIFKDLIKLYKSRGYRIPNFSINEHNLFKINPLLESNTAAISNGLIANQLLKKNDESEKIISYLKKLGGILSEKLTDDIFKKDFKKIKIAKFKNLNEEDSVEELKKQIEILTNLINTNALDKLDEPKKVNYQNHSRQNSIKSYKYKSNKKLCLNNQRNTFSRINSRILKGNDINFFNERRVSTESSMTSGSYYHKKKSQLGKAPQNILSILNFNINTQGKKASKTPKDLKIPTLNLKKINQKPDENILILSSRNEIDITPKKLKFSSQKINNMFMNELKTLKTPRKNKVNLTRKTIKEMKENLMPNPPLAFNQRHLSTVKNFLDNDSLISDEYVENNINTTSKKKSVYPYTNRNEFVNYAYYKFSKRGIENCENYVKNYLNKVKGFNDDKVQNFFQNIYDKNIKNNLEELENQIAENDIYDKTERLYLNNHLIKRILPTLKNLNEKDKAILKLEKNLAQSIINK